MKAYAVDRIMHKDVKTDIVIIDNCVYSKLAIEHIISNMNICLSIFSFDCVTDYKLWSQANHYNKNVLIIVNASSTPLYGEDVSGFLRYENSREKRDAGKRRILLLTSKGPHWTYKNFITAHTFLTDGFFPRLVFIDDIKGYGLGSFRRLLFQFVQGLHITFPCLILNNTRTVSSFTSADIRIISMILTGRSVRGFSGRHGISVKTLYAQRDSVLKKLVRKHTIPETEA